MRLKALILVATLLFTVAWVPATALDPVENISAAGVAANSTAFNATNFQWNPETGLYTRWWFNTSRVFFDPFGFFYGTFLPLAGLMGGWGWLGFTIWGAISTAFYLETQNSTMPFVIMVISGSVLSYIMGTEQILLLILVVAFTGGGILAKVILGRP